MAAVSPLSDYRKSETLFLEIGLEAYVQLLAFFIELDHLRITYSKSAILDHLRLIALFKWWHRYVIVLYLYQKGIRKLLRKILCH